MGNHKVNGRAMSMPGGLAVGTGVSITATVFSGLLLTWMVMNGKLAMNAVGYGIMVQLLLASWLGAITAYRKIKHRKMLVCMLMGGIYFAVLLTATALLFGGQYEGVAVTALLILGGSGAAALTGKGRGPAGVNHRKRK